MVARGFRLFALLVLAWPALASAATTGWSDVHVRIYDTADLRAALVNRALVTAGRTLAPAAVDVRWTHCPPERRAARTGVTTSPRCAQPLHSGELAVRVVRGTMPPGYRGTLPLGDAFVDRSSGAGVLATVYVDRVEWLARAAASDLSALLGWAIAHELGHLLMGTAGHGLGGGIMRAEWTREEVRRARPQDWQLATPDSTRIRQRVERAIDVG